MPVWIVLLSCFVDLLLKDGQLRNVQPASVWFHRSPKKHIALWPKSGGYGNWCNGKNICLILAAEMPQKDRADPLGGIMEFHLLKWPCADPYSCLFCSCDLTAFQVFEWDTLCTPKPEKLYQFQTTRSFVCFAVQFGIHLTNLGQQLASASDSTTAAQDQQKLMGSMASRWRSRTSSALVCLQHQLLLEKSSCPPLLCFTLVGGVESPPVANLCWNKLSGAVLLVCLSCAGQITVTPDAHPSRQF
jgi:hypothetical protein